MKVPQPTMKFWLVALLASGTATSWGQADDAVGLPEISGPRAVASRWKVISVKPTNLQGKLTASLTNTSGKFDLYVRKGSAPTLTSYDFKLSNDNQSKTITVTNRSAPALTSDTWYIASYARFPGTVKLTATASTTPSEFSIKGASPFTGGTSFRVWAPNATAANIAGQFNSWSATAAPLVNEGAGWWSVDLRGASAGQQYKFVLKNGASTIWKNDPWAKQLTNSVGNSIIHNPSGYVWQTNNFQTPTFNNLVMYEMHIGTFNDSPGGAPGTFLTAINRLDHLQNMGINCIELMPVQEFPGDYSWGYNPSFPFSVESAYGGPDNLKKFVDAANQRGIAVLMDVVHNHYGPSDLDLWRFDGWYQGSYGGAFFYNDARASTPWGDTRPDFGRSEVRQYIRDSQTMFAQEFRMSGFRYDSTLNMRNTNSGSNPDGWSLLQWLNNELDASEPWKINIAEDLQGDAYLTRSTATGGAGFDSQWSGFVHTLRTALSTGDDNARDMNAVKGALNERFNNDVFQRVIYTESHDENANGNKRMPSTIDSANPASYWSQKRSTLGAAITLTAPGIPMLFQGQEFLEDGWFADTDPVDWSKLTTYSGIANLYRDLISLRRNLTGRTNGLRGQGMNAFHTNTTGKVLAYHRYMNGGTNDDVVVVANFKNTTYSGYRIGLPRAGNWSVVFNSDSTYYSSLFGNLNCQNLTAGAPAQDGLAQSGTVNLAPYSVVILAKD